MAGETSSRKPGHTLPQTPASRLLVPSHPGMPVLVSTLGAFMKHLMYAWCPAEPSFPNVSWVRVYVRLCVDSRGHLPCHREQHAPCLGTQQAG